MPEASFRNYYADLMISHGATSAQIKSAFDVIAERHVSDTSGNSDSAEYERAKEAYEILSSTGTRIDYDRSYHRYRMRQALEEDGKREKDTRTAQFEHEEAEREAKDAYYGHPSSSSEPDMAQRRDSGESYDCMGAEQMDL